MLTVPNISTQFRYGTVTLLFVTLIIIWLSGEDVIRVLDDILTDPTHLEDLGAHYDESYEGDQQSELTHNDRSIDEEKH